MYRYILVFAILSMAIAQPVAADGLMIAKDENYPKDFLQSRVTQVSVEIHGLVAETIVYQEFVNEWHKPVDAVYAFPLPAEARATLFLYWRNDTTFKAILQVRQQVTNPGTGEGGIIAKVNNYIGRNGIKVELQDIAPQGIQRVELHYLSLCDYFRGEYTYRFPLATGDFIPYPLEHLSFDIDVESNSDITSFDIPTHPQYRVLRNEARHVHLTVEAPKTYVASDLEFRYHTDNSELGVDFYSVANDSMDGHYALFIRPQQEASMSEVLPKRIIFLLGNSSRMYGYKLEQSLAAISGALALLHARDQFNLMLFNSRVEFWQSAPVAATTTNLQSAKNYLSSVTSRHGSRMDLGLEQALAQIGDDNLSNAILLFTDGRSPIDPRALAALNQYQTGIFPIGIGEDLDRARLEMTAALNYGFVTYLRESDNLSAGMLRVFKQISQPILKNTAMEIGQAGVYQILPTTIPTTYAGSFFFSTGRYRRPGSSALSIAGESPAGLRTFDFRLTFSNETTPHKFAEHLWAKEMIDALEREIEIYGETPALKDSLIAISLRYNIRCRYTAYVADYEEVYTGVKQSHTANPAVPVSYLMGNYPNPFNPETTIQFFLSASAAHASVKLIKIYNALGQLVAIIDISHLARGMHTIRFDGRDSSGRPLPSGMYFVRLQVGNEVSTIRMTLLR